MTETTHVYTATVNGFDLGTVSGSIRLDSGRTPHVQSDVTVGIPGEWSSSEIPNPLKAEDTLTVPTWTPRADILAALDPRRSPTPRVTITAARDGGTPRVFDLHVRDMNVDHSEGTVSLVLASDEALLSDYAPLTDVDLYEMAGDLKALTAAVIGTTFGVTPEISGPTVDRTPYWDATNYAQNPSFETNTDRWEVVGAGGARDTTWHAVGAASLRITANRPDSYARTIDAELGVLRAGTVYTVSADFHIAGALPGETNPRTRRIVAFVKAPSLGPNYVEYASEALPNTPNATGRRAVTFRIPEDATEAFVRFYNGHPSGSIWIDAVSVTADSRHTPYFDRTWPPSPGYVYFANANGTSQRHAVVDGPSPDAFLWQAGQSAMDFLHPLVQSVGLRLVCDELRRWSLRSETFSAPGTLTLRHGVNLIEERQGISRDAGFWFDAAVRKYSWKDPVTGAQLERVDAFAAITPHTRLSLIELTTPYPGPGRAEYAVRRAQGVGREVTVSTVAQWDAAAEMSMQLILEYTTPQVAKVQALTFDLSDDRMTITARTVDTPEGAINLLPNTINALTGTINGL